MAQATQVGENDEAYILSVATTSDGGYIAVGGFYSSIQVGDYTLQGKNPSTPDGMIIKYSREEEVEWATSIGGSNFDYINSIAETSDGGYIVGGYFDSSSIQVGEYTLTNNEGGYYNDGMIIKYSREGEVEWATSVGGDTEDEIISVAGTEDGGAIAGGYFGSDEIQVGEHTLANNGGYDGMIIKYSNIGEIEWVKNIGGSSGDSISSVASTSDGGYIVGGTFGGTIQVGDYTLTSNGALDGMIIKYASSGEVEWARNAGGSSGDSISSVATTSDGGYIVGGYFESNNIQLGENTLTNNGSEDGMIIKYASSGEVEWATSVGGSSSDQIKSVDTTSDGGYIVGGYFESNSIQLGNYTLTDNGNGNGMIIKYSREGEVEWAKSVGGGSEDYIYSVSGTSDGGYIAGGKFCSFIFQIGEYSFVNTSAITGIIIRFENVAVNNPIKAEGIGASNDDEIHSVAVTEDGGYIAVGYFESSSIQVGEYTLTNNGDRDGMIIKYSREGEVEWAKAIGGNSSDYILSVATIISYQ